jgi:hypothetical protein
MTEKVVGEIRFIETDDGFRIELKGDKGRLKEMGWGPSMMGPRGMGHGRGRKRFWRKMQHGHQHGPGHGCGPGPGMTGGPWFWWGREEDKFEESDEYEKPPKDV